MPDRIPMSPPIIFLDFDGVMNNTLTFIHAQQQDEKRTHDPVDIYAVAALNYIIDEVPECQIVVSSVWRFKGLDYCINKLVSHGFKYPGRVIGVTLNSGNSFRGDEVLAWMKENDRKDCSYVIIDDDCDFYEYQRERHVNTDLHTGGLTFKKAIEVIEKLTGMTIEI